MAQLAHRANFHTFGKFDYYLGNLAHYGHLTPPKYNLSKITNEHIVLMSGKNDGLADPRDVDRLKRELGGESSTNILEIYTRQKCLP